MNISLTLVENNNLIQEKILQSLRKQLSVLVNKSIPKIIDQIKLLMSEALMSEPEYGSLKTGTLKAEFGIYNDQDIDNIINMMVDTINVISNPIVYSGKGLSGGFTLTMIKSNDISGIIYSDSAMVIDQNNGYSLPWLEWLLLKGSDTIVENYSVNYTNSSRSRSGMALMVPSDGSWRVPPEFSGTEGDNWTTRAIAKSRQEIINIITTTISAEL